MSLPKNSATVWVCQSCMLHHANGECGDCHTDEGHDREPLYLIASCQPAMGMFREEHSDGCMHPEECDCETNPFSWSACDGCGSNLGGERYAMTIWWN